MMQWILLQMDKIPLQQEPQQQQEVLLRHLMHHVDAKVEAYKAEKAGGAA